MIPTMKQIQEFKSRMQDHTNECFNDSRWLKGNHMAYLLIKSLSQSVAVADYDMCKKIIAKLPPSLVKRHVSYYYPMYQELRRRVDQRKRSKYKRRITNKLIHLVQQHRADDAIDLVLDNRYDLEPVIVQSVLALKGE